MTVYIPIYSEAALTDAFRRLCAEAELTIIAEAGDKHGSTVWEAGAETRGLNRYVTLALTELDASPGRSQVEISIGADDGERFTHLPFKQWIAEQEPRGDLGGSMAPLPGNGSTHSDKARRNRSDVELLSALREAWERVLALRREDLNDSYLVVRSSRD